MKKKAAKKPTRKNDDLVPMSAIRRFARDVAERFQPDKIILFGSYAYGTPNRDSDVDILVVMPCRNPLSQATRIRFACPRDFAMDLMVRSPEVLASRVEGGDWFLREIVWQGKVLYDKLHSRMGA